MTARSKRGELADLGPIGESDDQIVDVLLRVASGALRRNEEDLRLNREFEPLVQMALDAPDVLYKREYSVRLQELSQGGAPTRLASMLVPGGRARPVYVRDFRDIHAVLSQGVLLLLDERKPYSKDLCRCIYCGRFYLARRNPKGGPANRSYCSEKHRLAYRNSGLRKEAPMGQPVAEHFLSIIKETLPNKADIVRADQSGDLRLLIDWRLGDAQRPNKRSKSIELRVSWEAISDYANSSGHQQKVADELLAKAVKAKLAEFDENHNAPREVVPPRETWVVATRDINT